MCVDLGESFHIGILAKFGFDTDENEPRKVRRTGLSVRGHAPVVRRRLEPTRLGPVGLPLAVMLAA